MNTHASMLRGINVSGHRRVPMDELKRVYVSLGYQSVRTYLQSGNVVFDCPAAGSPNLAAKIERRLRRQIGLEIPVLIRTHEELEGLVKKNPFADRDEGKVHVTFLYDRPEAFSTEKIDRAVGQGEAFSLAEREIYIFCPKGYGRTKLSNTFFERLLGVTATTRNWRTTRTLFSMTG